MSRRELLGIIKNTVIKKLSIPNTTFSDSQNEEDFIFPKVTELNLFYNFMEENIKLTQATLNACPNVEVINLDQILLSQ